MDPIVSLVIVLGLMYLWCRQAWRTSREIVYERAEEGLETHGALLACLLLWPVYRWQRSQWWKYW